MSTTTYAKYSDHADRWILWSAETGEVKMLTSSTFAKDHNFTPKQEYYARFGEDALLSDEELHRLFETPTYRLNSATGAIEPSFEKKIDASTLTNPALYWPGEAEDSAAGRYYGRPAPESAGKLVRPA